MLSTHFWKKYFIDYDVLNELIPYDRLLEEICTKAHIKTGDLVLDAGSGTGNLSLHIEKHGGKVIGIDYSEEGILRHKTKQQNVKLLQHDLMKPLPFEDTMFEIVVSNNVLYTIPRSEREKIFQEFYRVLKPGGTVVIANLTINFKPFTIYLNHVTEYRRMHGLVKTISHLASLLLPTVRIFYYNYLIKKEHVSGSYDFFEIGEQKEYLQKTGFTNVSETELHYAGQAILNSATKPI